MKRFLPIILLLIGVAVLVGAFIFVKNKNSKSKTSSDEEASLIEVPLEGRPIVSLIPTADAHYLKLKIEKIKIESADTMEYELLYQTKEEVTQGTSGVVEDVKGKDSYENDLLLGSESAGKFRYDEGVETGTISLKFRNSQGKLLTKFDSDFHLQTNTDLLTSPDTVFKYELSGESKDYFLTMSTIGLPEKAPASVETEAYGVFSSSQKDNPGSVEVGFDNIYRWDGNSWTKLSANKSDNSGIFFGSNQ